MSVQYLVGDTREQTATIADGSVSLVACSPPFIALRSYLPADHPMKHAEIGSEPDPATFLNTLLALTAEWGRVLAPWGSIAIELGDTYSGGSSEGTDTRSPESQRFRGWADGDLKPKNGQTWPRPKCLALVPQLYAASLAYGRNLLTGEPSPAGQWLVRNMIVWHRPNPAVGALGDKFRPSTSYITVATRSPKRWFDLTAVRGEPSPNTHARTAKGVESRPNDTPSGGRADANWSTLPIVRESAGAPPLDAWFDEHDTWTMTTQPSSLAHYAMWPAKLAERLVLSMCPAEVCGTCGEPRRRVERTTNAVGKAVQRTAHRLSPSGAGDGRVGVVDVNDAPDHSERITLGFTDCGHDNYQPGVVLDPFAGTGTTLAVADCHGRDAIGIDIDERNHALYPARYAEVRKALFGTRPETPGQLDLFGGAA